MVKYNSWIDRLGQSSRYSFSNKHARWTNFCAERRVWKEAPALWPKKLSFVQRQLGIIPLQIVWKSFTLLSFVLMFSPIHYCLTVVPSNFKLRYIYFVCVNIISLNLKRFSIGGSTSSFVFIFSSHILIGYIELNSYLSILLTFDQYFKSK